MAGSVKGLVVQIGGDTSGLSKALSSVESATRSLNSELRKINTGLKFDDHSTVLLSQKQTVLKEKIEATSQKLNELEKAKREADRQLESNSASVSAENYRALEREIESTRNELQRLYTESSGWTKLGTGLQNFGSGLQNVGQAVEGLGQKLMPVSAMASSLMAMGVKYNAQLEQYKVALTTLTGSTEEAERVMKQVQDDAQKTPFDVEGLTRANQLLISTGLGADESRDVILALGNAISATGGGNAELQRMAINLQQIKNVGKASSLDIKQFAYAGIDIYGLLADYLHITKEEASGLKVTWEDLSNALIYASQEGGRYFGAMEQQSYTLNGQMSNLKDSFSRMAGSLTESLSPSIINLMDRVTLLIDKFNNADEETKKNIANIVKFVAVVGPGLMIIGKIISGFGSLLIHIGAICNAIGKLSAFLKVSGGLMAVLKSGILKLIAPIKALFAFIVANPIVLIIAGIVALIAIIVHLWKTNENFRNAVINIWNKIKDVFSKVGSFIVNLFTVTIPNAWNSFLEGINTLKEEILQRIEAIKQFFNDLGNNILQTLQNGWNSIVSFFTESIPNFVNSVIEWIKNIPYNIGYILGYTLGSIIKFGMDLWTWLTTTIVQIGENIKTFLTNLPEMIKAFMALIIIKLAEWAVSVWDWINNTLVPIIDAIVAWFATLPERIWTWLLGVIQKIIEWGVNTYNNAVSWCTKIINGIVNFFKQLPGKIWEFLVQTFEKTREWLQNMFNLVKTKIPEIISAIVDKFMELPGKMLEIGRNIVEGLWNGIMNAKDWLLGKISEFAQGVLQGMKDAMGIHSPSALFRDQVGKFIAEGIGVGFENNINGVINRMRGSLLEGTDKLSSIGVNLNPMKENGAGNTFNVNIYTEHLNEEEIDRIVDHIQYEFGNAF